MGKRCLVEGDRRRQAGAGPATIPPTQLFEALGLSASRVFHCCINYVFHSPLEHNMDGLYFFSYDWNVIVRISELPEKNILSSRNVLRTPSLLE